MLILGAVGQNSNADFKSTFLIGEPEGRYISPYSTLSWLSKDLDDNWRNRVIGMIGGDTHADIMARSTAKDFGRVDGVDRESWRKRISTLRSNGISPVVWMISDDSPDVYARGLDNQIDYQNQVVSAVDDVVSHYVVCLECDEYYSPAQVSKLIGELRKKTDRPIGVHLKPGVKAEYIKDADIIYLQTGFNLNEEQFRQEIENALRFGKPVVVSEYDLRGTSERAKSFGNIACSYAGVVGTGNGRGTTSCQTLEWGQAKKKKWHQNHEKEIVVFGIAVATLFAMLKDTPKLKLYVDDNSYELGLNSGGYNLQYSEDKIAATYRIDF
tara:strand:- start:689 stop:1666 length:978 start_codon:yes stop_codon:yes gene_type:complete